MREFSIERFREAFLTAEYVVMGEQTRDFSVLELTRVLPGKGR